MNTANTTISLLRLQTLLSTCLGRGIFVNLTFPSPTIAYPWLTSSRSNYCHPFTFISGTRIQETALLRLAQSVTRSLSAISNVVREYLDPLVKADHCTQKSVILASEQTSQKN